MTTFPVDCTFCAAPALVSTCGHCFACAEHLELFADTPCFDARCNGRIVRFPRVDRNSSNPVSSNAVGESAGPRCPSCSHPHSPGYVLRFCIMCGSALAAAAAGGGAQADHAAAAPSQPAAPAGLSFATSAPTPAQQQQAQMNCPVCTRRLDGIPRDAAPDPAGDAVVALAPCSHHVHRACAPARYPGRCARCRGSVTACHADVEFSTLVRVHLQSLASLSAATTAGSSPVAAAAATGGGEPEYDYNFECEVCLSTMTDPSVSRCGHAACTTCWREVLRRSGGRGPCPMCRAPVIQDQLIRLFGIGVTPRTSPTSTPRSQQNALAGFTYTGADDGVDAPDVVAAADTAGGGAAAQAPAPMQQGVELSPEDDAAMIAAGYSMCSTCHARRTVASFTKSQLRRELATRRCKRCVEAATSLERAAVQQAREQRAAEQENARFDLARRALLDQERAAARAAEARRRAEEGRRIEQVQRAAQQAERDRRERELQEERQQQEELRRERDRERAAARARRVQEEERRRAAREREAEAAVDPVAEEDERRRREQQEQAWATLIEVQQRRAAEQSNTNRRPAAVPNLRSVAVTSRAGGAASELRDMVDDAEDAMRAGGGARGLDGYDDDEHDVDEFQCASCEYWLGREHFSNAQLRRKGYAKCKRCVSRGD